MPDDFDPQKQLVQVPQYSGHVVRRSMDPAVGSKVAVVYIEATPAAAGQINSLLSQIQALATQYGQMVWTPTAEPDCIPRIHLRAIVQTDVQEEEGG